jgi:hypothetical protein
VIHAVGPNYNEYCCQNWEENSSFEDGSDDGRGVAAEPEDAGKPDDPYAKGHALLRSAYQESLDLAYDAKCCQVAFSLLSAGVYRGPLTLDLVLELGVSAITEWAHRQHLQQQKQKVDGDGGDRSQQQQVPAEVPSRNDKAASQRHQREPIKETTTPARMEVILCAYSPFEVNALKRACRSVLLES